MEKIMEVAVYAMVYLGSALMIYNIYGFIRFARYVKGLGRFRGISILYIPIVLLILFFLGYMAVGLFGDPDLIVSGILFGGSIFVFVMYILLNRITVRVVESERLKTELTAAEEGNRAKTEFLSSVSHEMRTPMNAIIGLSAVMMNEPDVTENTKEQLGKIERSAKHLLRLIDSILDLNQIEAGEMTVKADTFSLSALLERINDEFGAKCADKGLQYHSAFEAQTGRFVSDERMISKILTELLDNAVKFTDAPGTVELFVTDEPTDDGLRTFRFTVKDTGAGIEKEFLPKVFNTFTREDAGTTNRYGGSGLGLAVTKKMVDLLGGTIQVESKKKQGTTFTVSLPLGTQDAPIAAKEDHALASLEGVRVLIVEDIDENAEIAADLLDLEGALSERAENGLRGVEMFSASPAGYYDAILMDLRMPVMDGLTSAKEIRRLERRDAQSVPIIALTANAFESDIRQTLAAGMNDHLSKPTDADLLYASLKKQIGQARYEETRDRG